MVIILKKKRENIDNHTSVCAVTGWAILSVRTSLPKTRCMVNRQAL